jgi:hypothetical protein
MKQCVAELFELIALTEAMNRRIDTYSGDDVIVARLDGEPIGSSTPSAPSPGSRRSRSTATSP